jgi:RHS repeat-associated protein
VPGPRRRQPTWIGRRFTTFAYDGLGRLIACTQPLAPGNPGAGSETEHYYYDGVRRVQTIVPLGDPLPDRTRAEYVYGAGYVDEFVLQTYRAADPVSDPTFYHAYMLQDANYNVVALLTPAGDVMQQYTWEPYGTVLNVDMLAIPPPGQPQAINAIGHQGLFFYRFNGTTGDNAPLCTAAVGLYHNRNRWYTPHLGRFTTPDPNETAMMVVNAMAINGDTLALMLEGFDALGHFGDGMNVYGYQRSNPVDGSDPLGLDAYDDAMGDYVGQNLYALGMLNKGSGMVALGLNATLSIASSFLPGSGLYEAFKSIQLLADGKGGFLDALNVAATAFPLAAGAQSAIALRGLFKAQGLLRRGLNIASKLVGHHTIPKVVLDELRRVNPSPRISEGDWLRA